MFLNQMYKAFGPNITSPTTIRIQLTYSQKLKLNLLVVCNLNSYIEGDNHMPL